MHNRSRATSAGSGICTPRRIQPRQHKGRQRVPEGSERAETGCCWSGDIRQHEPIDAGIPYQQLQHAGVSTTRLREIISQQEPELRAVVEPLAEGKVKPAIVALNSQGRVHHMEDRNERFAAIAKHYALDPKRTLVVSPDNDSRADLNAVIHRPCK